MTQVDGFLLGLASGLVVLTLTAYRRVSPGWLRWLLLVTGLLMLSRYAMFALFTFEATSPCWLVSGIGLTLPGIFAVDQLVRHPAMTPKKLLRWYVPFLLAQGLTILSPGWEWTASILTSLFVIVFLWIGGLLVRKLPDRRIRFALLGLCLSYLSFGIAGLLLAFGHWHLRPFLYSEMFVLLALWYAYETSADLR